MDKWFKVAATAMTLFFMGLGASHASATNVKFNSFLEQVAFKGDFRVRHESFWKAQSTDRHRERYRLRLGTGFKFPSDMELKTRFASGTGEQVSTNQSFDNLSSQNTFFIDQAYLVMKGPMDSKIQAGRMSHPFWMVYSSDIVWDGDFSPMGFSQSISRDMGGNKWFLNLLEMVADEDSGSQNDQWMFGGQLGMNISRMDDDWALTAALAGYEWTNETAGTFGQGAANEGNRRTGTAPGTLSNNFRVAELTVEYWMRLMERPLSIQGTYINNIGNQLTPAENTGLQVGFIYGNTKSEGDWEIAYFNKRSESDATVADVADSDFGDGGTNRQGHIVWFARSMGAATTFNVKYFTTQVLNTALAPGLDDITRLQVDFSVKI